MKKTVSATEGAAETTVSTEMPATSDAAQVSTPAQESAPPAGPNPSEGGSYLRDPVTGELTKVED